MNDENPSILFIEDTFECLGRPSVGTFVSNVRRLTPGDAWVVRDGERLAHVLILCCCYLDGYCSIGTVTAGEGEKLPELRLGDTIEEHEDNPFRRPWDR